MDEQNENEGASARSSVTVWTTAKSGPQWKVRVVDGIGDDAIDTLIARAVRAYHKVGRDLETGDRPAFVGDEPGA